MRIAAITSVERGDVDRIINALAEDLLAAGSRPVGAIRGVSGRALSGDCDMDLRILPGFETVRITQDLGRHSRACRLDATALEDVVGMVAVELAEAADLFLLNKFGQQEVEGRGFRPLIAQAVEAGVPVLLGLPGINRVAFEEFADGMADYLVPSLDEVRAWYAAQGK